MATDLEATPVEATESEPPSPTVYSQFVFFSLDPAFRRLPELDREESRLEFAAALQRPGQPRTYVYSTLGLRADSELGIWRIGAGVEEFQEQSAALLRTRLGSHLRVSASLLGMTRPSQYVRSRSLQEQSLESEERGRYLVIYPFTKTVDWYLLDAETRQQMMTGHIRVGRQYPDIRQSLLYSFGVDDQEFIVCYEMEDLARFQQLVHELRGTEARRFTLSDTPIFTCVHRPLTETLALLG